MPQYLVIIDAPLHVEHAEHSHYAVSGVVSIAVWDRNIALKAFVAQQSDPGRFDGCAAIVTHLVKDVAPSYATRHRVRVETAAPRITARFV